MYIWRDIYLLGGGMAPVLLPENPMNGGAWWATVQGVAKGSDTTEHTHMYICVYICIHINKYMHRSLCYTPETNTIL